jgi:hypothetical protein
MTYYMNREEHLKVVALTNKLRVSGRNVYPDMWGRGFKEEGKLILVGTICLNCGELLKIPKLFGVGFCDYCIEKNVL